MMLVLNICLGYNFNLINSTNKYIKLIIFIIPSLLEQSGGMESIVNIMS